MLSRLAVRSVQESKPCLSVLARSSSAVAEPKKDEVGYERRKRPIYPGKVRMGFVPEEWFQLLYPKTGVTGPYLFGLSFTTYLLSKEIIVMEHELWGGISLAALAVIGIKSLGPKVAAALDKQIEDENKTLDSARDFSIGNMTQLIEEEKLHQHEAKGQTMLFDAKRENIGLQLEAAYRERLAQIHTQVKKKLDYQLEIANIESRFEQKHMVNWIVENVRKSITPAQEAATLKQCLSDLKGISAKA